MANEIDEVTVEIIEAFGDAWKRNDVDGVGSADRPYGS